MAWYDITYRCGHDGREQIYGPTKDRERKAEWIGDHKVCPDCWDKWRGTEEEYKARQEEHETRNMVAATENDMAGRPALVGTEKQIAWAETLRSDLLGEADTIRQALVARPLTGESGEEINRLYPIWYEEISAITSAQWWIDHRYESRDDVMAGRNPMAIFGMVMDGRTPKADPASLFRAWVLERRKAEKIAAIPKPSRPEFMAAWGGGKKWVWNGKTYGNPKYGPVRIYLQINGDRNGTEIKLSGDDAKALESYMAAKAAYKAACDQVPAMLAEEDKARAARAAEAHEAKQAELAAPLNAIVAHAADTITEADCTFDAYGNWTGATVDGHTFAAGFSAGEVGDIDGRRNAGPALMARADSRDNVSRLQTRIREITAERRHRLEDQKRQVEMDAIKRGHAATVERTRKQSDNTTIVLDTGFTIRAHVATQKDLWPDCIAAQAWRYFGLADDLARIGAEAEAIYRARG